MHRMGITLVAALTVMASLCNFGRASEAVLSELSPFYCQEFQQEPLFGYLDSQGAVIVRPQFTSASSFSKHGLAVAQDRKKQQCIIDAAGKTVARLSYRKLLPFGDDGLAPVCTDDGKWGYVDGTGVVVIPCQYDGAQPFSKGLAIVRQGARAGAIDTRGQVVIPFEYLHLSGFSDHSDVAVAEKGWLCSLVDRNGKTVVPAEYEVIAHPGEADSGGLVAVKKDGRWGYIDHAGTVRIPFGYSYAGPFRHGFAPVSEHGRLNRDRLVDGLAGFIDRTASWVVDPKYEMAGPFTSRGIATVRLNGRYGIINRAGVMIVRPTYVFASSESDHSGLVWVREDGRYYWVDADGERYDAYETLQNGIVHIVKDGEGEYRTARGETVLRTAWSYKAGQRRIRVWNDAGTVSFP